ncbi:oxidative stress-induced growth inhibitor 1 isoform X2 [Phalacrocorax aristotelis]|uniref:oxidative stress-induced growth inhibitor 1 isoform X2 n=1 Tax=Phalacrocorax aristotelis TaxID=126867 RepID=UPI003F4C9130
MLPDRKMYGLLNRPQSKSGFKPLPVVIIGNGPSGICLSYLLSGYVPYLKRHSIHPHPILQRKLEEAPDISILDQSIEGSMITLSRGDWMGLPDLPFKDWLKQKRRGLRNNRATAEDIAQYYQHYVMKKGLQKNFSCDTVVTSVKKVSAESISNHAQKDLQESSDSLWNLNEKSTEVFQVDGFFKTVKGDKEPFSIYAENVVLATGTYDGPTWLGVKGENLSYVHHQLSALEEAVKNIGVMSDPVLIVGAGLTAADAILFAHHCNIPVIHVFRRRVSDPGLIFNQLPKMMYPEYHKVHQMMKEQSAACAGPYECYVSFPEHHVLSFGKDKKCIIQDKNGYQKAYKISMALVLTGSNPNLSFLPNNGMDLAMDSDQPVNPKRNPIDVDPFTYECTQEKGLYALGPLAGDNFVRFVQGGALAVARSLLKKANKNPP